MRIALMLTTVVAGLSFVSAANADLKCANNSQQIYTCNSSEKDLMIEEAVLCKNKKGKYELTVAGGGEEAPTMVVEQIIRMGATQYKGSDEGVSLSLTLLAGAAPVKDENGAFYQSATAKLVLDGATTSSKMKCYVTSLNNH